jgi:hypothetical protein
MWRERHINQTAKNRVEPRHLELRYIFIGQLKGSIWSISSKLNFCCILVFLCNTLTSKGWNNQTNIPYGVMSMFIHQISDQPTKSWGIKTGYMLRAVIWLVNILIILHMIRLSKMNWRLSDLTPYGMLLDVSISNF